MVSIEGVDYSYARPTAAELKTADKKFAVRYITVPGPSNKGISAAEFSSLHSAGLEVAVTYEGAAADMKKGRSQGVADAKAAQANLKAINGLNDNLPVYFACDWDATPAEQAAINSYLDGAASVLGIDRVGMYGGYYPLKRAKAAGKVTWLWQTYAWSGGNILPGIHLYQYKNDVKLGRGTVDLVRALKSEYGQHGVEAEKPAPAPKPVEAPKPKPNVITATPDYNGIYFFKGDASEDVYIYEPVSGTKRHVTAAEWAIVKGYGHATVLTIDQAKADEVPTAA